MKKSGRRTIIVYCLLIPLLFGNWGFLVHRTINQLAIYQLPKSMQPFFYTNREYLVKHSVRPDLRRNEDPTEAPKHFIDLEPFGDSAAWKMPHTWDSAVTLYSKDTLVKYGFVPYWIGEMKGKLTAALQMGNKDSILFYAADLGHYIADAHVPLHTSINYDGQLSNQKGLHSLWESTIPEIALNDYDLYSKHKATYLAHPEEAVWEMIQQTNLLVKNVFEQERETSKSFVDSLKYRIQIRNGRESRSYTSAFARAYSQRLENTINQQLLHSANLLADFLYTSWVDAGKPNLNKLNGSVSKQGKRNLKEEKKRYRTNELIKNNLLLARQEKGSED